MAHKPISLTKRPKGGCAMWVLLFGSTAALGGWRIVEAVL